MGYNMSKITIFVQNFHPQDEAVSKEAAMLSREFKTKIFNFRTKNIFTITYDLLKLLLLNSKNNHIYTSLGDTIFLRFIRNKENTILTAATYSDRRKIEKNLIYLKKIKFIIVETKTQKDTLIELGLDEKKIKVIYPGIKVKKEIPIKQKNKNFKILFASSPPKKSLFESRGVNLILNLACEMPKIEFILLWRRIGYKKLKREINKRRITNVVVINKTIKNIDEEINAVDIVIAPFISTTNKPVPNSIIEGMANGKPCIISNKVEIKYLIEKEKCGLVVEPNKEEMKKAIIFMKQNYEYFQKKCDYVFKKYFSEDKFKKEYKKIYQNL